MRFTNRLLWPCVAILCWMGPSHAQTFPPQGTDTFASWSPFCVTIGAITYLGYNANDPATVVGRSDPSSETAEGALAVPTGACTACSPTVSDLDIDCWATGAGGAVVRREVHTEMLSLDLVGTFGIYTIEYLAGQPARDALATVGAAAKYRNTFGEVESNDLAGNPAADFPATSHWAVHGVVRIAPPPAGTSGVFYADVPILMVQRNLAGFPPPPDVFYGNEGGTLFEAGGLACGMLPVVLLDAVSDAVVGSLCADLTHNALNRRKPIRIEADPDGFMDLTGSNGVGPDPSGLYHVVVRNAAHEPMDYTRVEIRFPNCQDLVIAANQTYPGVILDSCSPPVVHAMTNAAGTATFVVSGSAANRGATQPASPCASIYAGDVGDPLVYLGDVPVAAPDENGVNGVDATDVSLFLEDYGAGYFQRSDFDGNAIVDSADLSRLLGTYFDDGSRETPQRCDGAPTLISPDVVVGGLRLSWSECRGAGGTALRTSACGANTGSNQLVGSVVLPANVSDVVGVEATIEVYGNTGEALPNWWHLEQGGCRPTSVSTSFDFTAGPFGCADVWSGQANGGSRWDGPAVAGEIHRARHRVLAAVPPASALALTGGQESYLFRVNINNQKTTGTGSCANCTKPMALVLTSVRLTRSGGLPDKLIYPSQADDALRAVYWQGTPTGYPTGVGKSASAPPAARLEKAVPNPSAGPFTIGFALPRSSRGSLAIYDLAGRRVRELMSGELRAGEHSAVWDGRTDRATEAPAGVYVYRLRTREGDLNRTLVKLR